METGNASIEVQHLLTKAARLPCKFDPFHGGMKLTTGSDFHGELDGSWTASMDGCGAM